MIILFDGCLRQFVNRDFHVFEACHWSAKIEVFDVKAHVMGIWCADYAVP